MDMKPMIYVTSVLEFVRIARRSTVSKGRPCRGPAQRLIERTLCSQELDKLMDKLRAIEFDICSFLVNIMGNLLIFTQKSRVHDIAGVDVGGEMDVAFWHQAFYVIQEGEVRFGEIWRACWVLRLGCHFLGVQYIRDVVLPMTCEHVSPIKLRFLDLTSTVKLH